MRVFQRVDILSQLVHSPLGLGFTVRRVKDMHQRPDQTAETVHKTLIFAFQLGNGLLVLSRSIAGLLEEAPAQLP